MNGVPTGYCNGVVSVISGEASDLLTRATRPQSLIFTIYGAYSRVLESWLSVASLVEMMQALEIEEATVRSALSRFKRRGILIADKRGGAAGYSLSDGARTTFDIGDARVLERREVHSDQGWVLAAFSIPESNRDLRYRLRSRLIWLGFAQVTGGLWIAPAQLKEELLALAKDLAVEKYMDIFSSTHTAFRPTTEAVASWWDLDSIARMHTAFFEAHQPLVAKWTHHAQGSLQEAFVDYTRVLTAWRHLPYLDPGLPANFLPSDWPGYKSSEAFFTLKDKLANDALRHVRNIVQI